MGKGANRVPLFLISFVCLFLSSYAKEMVQLKTPCGEILGLREDGIDSFLGLN